MDLYYTAISPPARSAYIVAKHLGLKVNLKEIDLFGGGQLKEEFVKVIFWVFFSNQTQNLL